MESMRYQQKIFHKLRIILIEMMREEDIVDRLDKMVKRCHELVIQSLEKSVNQKFVQRYLVDQKIDNQVESLFVNNEAGIVKLTFQTHTQAMNFYENRSFNDVLMNRKLNVYFNLSASREDIKKYFLRGINEENVRRVFEKCRKYGIIRMDTLYGYKSLLKPTCIFSYLRSQHLNSQEFKDLQQQLGAIYVKLDHYYDKGSSHLNESQIKKIIPLPNMPLPLPYPLPLPKVLPAAYEALRGSKINQTLPATLTFLTSHQEQDDQVGHSDQAIKMRLRDHIGIEIQQILIDRTLLPTVNPKIKRVVISRQIEFQEVEEAEEAYLNLQKCLKEEKINGIVYLYEPDSISTLLVVRPELFIVNIRDGVCIIYQRMQIESKSVMLALFSYKEFDDVIVQKEKMKATLFKSSEITIFGQSCNDKMEPAKEIPRK